MKSTEVVLSVLHGDSVKVEVKGRASDGTFTEAAEVEVSPGECVSFLLPQGSSLQVFGLKEGEA